MDAKAIDPHVRVGHVDLKLYWDRPREQWPRTADGGLAMGIHRLNLDSLLAEK